MTKGKILIDLGCFCKILLDLGLSWFSVVDAIWSHTLVHMSTRPTHLMAAWHTALIHSALKAGKDGQKGSWAVELICTQA